VIDLDPNYLMKDDSFGGQSGGGGNGGASSDGEGGRPGEGYPSQQQFQPNGFQSRNENMNMNMNMNDTGMEEIFIH
jgi:hypothetical protein